MMKPKISKLERQALRFAYQLALGNYPKPAYVYPALSTNGGALLSRFQWIAPDSAPDCLYLSEDILSALVVKGYMHTAYHENEQLWLYQLTAEGCSAMGWYIPPLSWNRAIGRDPSRMWVESHRRPRNRYPFARRPQAFLLRDGVPADLRKRYRRG